MSFNPKKLLNLVKDTISKMSADKIVQTDSPIFNKLPPSLDLNEYIKFGEKKISSVQKSVQQFYNSVVESTIMTGSTKRNEEINKLWKRKDQISYRKQPEDICKAIHILNLLELTFDEKQTIELVEEFVAHIRKYPEIKNQAIKHGAVRILLNKGLMVTNEETKGAIREALTILGYVNPVSGRGIRILSIDGGGIRGVLVLEMLKKLEELTGKRTYELFDLFCGVSTGAVLTYSIGMHFWKLDYIIEKYEELSREIFKQSAFWGTGNLVWTHAYYNTALWEEKLKAYFGNDLLISTSRNPQCPKLCVVSAVVNQSQVSAYVFRNYALSWRFQSQYDGTHDVEVWKAARASAAAPTYFEEFRIKDLIHQDGGILANNPTAIAIHEAKLLWPNTPIQCVVSFGTGRSIPVRKESLKQSKSTPNGNVGTSWSNKFYKILDSATDTQAVHVMLSDLLPESVYYRFNPYLTEMIEMAETDHRKHEQLRRDALMYLRRNEDKFHEAAKTLMLKKTIGQKLRDQIEFQKDLMGF